MAALEARSALQVRVLADAARTAVRTACYAVGSGVARRSAGSVVSLGGVIRRAGAASPVATVKDVFGAIVAACAARVGRRYGAVRVDRRSSAVGL